MLTLSTGQSKDIYSQVRDAAVFVSLSADTAAVQAVGAIAHSSAWFFIGRVFERTASRACSSVG